MRARLTMALAAALALDAAPVAAACTARDAWRGPDKAMHFAAGAGIAAAVTLQQRNAWAGFAAGVAAGALKEVYDRDRPERHTCSVQDFAVTAAGAAAGAYGARWALAVGPRGQVAAFYRTQF
ncbi:MAG: hypothetical protein LW712_15500 [Burkholderiaceae bacterium]|nr:hypothetical protein [Burkholderiaceae bacterium]